MNSSAVHTQTAAIDYSQQMSLFEEEQHGAIVPPSNMSKSCVGRMPALHVVGDRPEVKPHHMRM